MMADKDTKDYLAAILPHCKTAVFTKPSNPRAEDENELMCEGECFCRDVVSVKDPKDAYKKAKEPCEKRRYAACVSVRFTCFPTFSESPKKLDISLLF